MVFLSIFLPINFILPPIFVFLLNVIDEASSLLDLIFFDTFNVFNNLYTSLKLSILGP